MSFRKSTAMILTAGIMVSVVLVQASKVEPASDHKTVSKSEKNHSSTEKSPKQLSVQTTCPVMGGKINKGLYAEHEGKRVYFCCGGCSSSFKKNPEKYLKKLEASGQKAEVLSKKCHKHDKMESSSHSREKSSSHMKNENKESSGSHMGHH